MRTTTSSRQLLVGWLGTYAIVIPAFGALFVGLVMLRGVLSRTTAYLALAMGVVGILHLP